MIYFEIRFFHIVLFWIPPKNYLGSYQPHHEESRRFGDLPILQVRQNSTPEMTFDVEEVSNRKKHMIIYCELVVQQLINLINPGPSNS